MNGIKQKRLALGLTQKQLANLLDVEQNTVSQWESDKRFPKKEMLRKLTNILQCTADDLLEISYKSE